jgi:ankyrin repeat protein
LRGCFPPALRRSLEELPKTLDTTYEHILLGIESAKREYAYRLLQCLAVSIRPLRVEELAEVLAVRLDDGEESEYHSDWRPNDARQAVLSACSSLITIVNADGSPIVQFSHFSVKEFLMSSRLANAGEQLSLYRVLPHSAHLFIARAALSVLLNLGDNVDKSAVQKRPFAIYAARYWVDHAKFKGVSSSLQDLMECLFDPEKPYFATWVWIFDIDRPWRGSMATVQPTEPEAKPLYYAALCGFCNLTEHLTTTHQMVVNAGGGDHGTALNAAFAKGELDTARTLLRKGANVNAVDLRGDSSLHRAAEAGHRAVVELLLEHQADVNLRTGEGGVAPLHLAAQAGELDICRLLLKQGTGVASKARDGWTALHFASRMGHLGIVQELLVHGADANDQTDKYSTSLHMASLAGHLEIVKLLVRHGAELERANIDQQTALHHACHESCRAWGLELARYLIEQGANTMSKDKYGDIPLHKASRNGYLDLVEIFLEVGMDINTQNADEETPFNLASGSGNLEVVILLIKHGVDVNRRDKLGWTPLHRAARYGHLYIVLLLLCHGVDIQVQNHETPLANEDWTSLHLASRYGHDDVVQLLLDHGADVNVRKADLWTPLHLASANGHLKVAELLIERGAVVDVRSKDQETPLDCASGNGELEVARLLIKCGSVVNSQDNRGWTPLHTAAWNGHLSVVELLLDSGADVNTQDNKGETPFDVAWDNGKHDVTSFLAGRSRNQYVLEIFSPTLLVAEMQGLTSEFVGPAPDPNGGNSSSSSNSLYSVFELDSGQIDAFQRLLDRGADVNERNELFAGKTPFHVASALGKLDIARTSIKYGADVNSRDNEGWTPLHSAAQKGLVDLVRLLLDNGADVHATERMGCTALHIASGCGNLESVRLLLEQGANVQIRNVHGRTPSQHALLYGRRDIALLLSEYDVGGV